MCVFSLLEPSRSLHPVSFVMFVMYSGALYAKNVQKYSNTRADGKWHLSWRVKCFSSTPVFGVLGCLYITSLFLILACFLEIRQNHHPGVAFKLSPEPLGTLLGGVIIWPVSVLSFCGSVYSLQAAGTGWAWPTTPHISPPTGTK